MKREPLFILTITGLLGVLFLFVFLTARERVRPFSPPDTPREWARADYNQFFVDPAPMRTEPVALHPPKVHTITKPDKLILSKESFAGEISDPRKPGGIYETMPGETIVKFPNGETVELLAIAVHRTPISEEKSAKHEITWCHPLSLQPITDELDNLLIKYSYAKPGQIHFFVALRYSGNEAHQWSGFKLYNGKTLRNIKGNSSGPSSPDKENISIARANLRCFRNTPTKIGFHLNWGDPELLKLDLRASEATAVLKNNAGIFSILGSENKRPHSVHISVSGRATHYKWSLEPATKGDSVKSFAYSQVYPSGLFYSMKYRVGDGAWGPMRSNQGMGILEFSRPIRQVKQVQIRYIPNINRIVFHTSGIPGLPEVENLFDTPLPEMEFTDRTLFKRAVSDATDLLWALPVGLSKEQMPVHFKEGSTPTDLLERYTELTGEEYNIDEATLSLITPPKRRSLLKTWLEKLISFF